MHHIKSKVFWFFFSKKNFLLPLIVDRAHA
jgi:hypothetical protein